MTGSELRAIRQQLGLSLSAMGWALGYQGSRQTAATTVHRYENGDREIPPWIGRLAQMYERHGIPGEWLAIDPRAAGSQTSG